VVIGEITWPGLLPLADDAYGLINAFPAEQFRVAQATLARRVDGALVDPLIVEVGIDYPATHDGAEPTDIVGVFGQTAHVYTALDELVPLAVVIGDDPYVAVAGVDPMFFLNGVAEDFVVPDVPADGGPITLTFGELPEGYEVIHNDGEPDRVTALISMMFDSPDRQDEAVITGSAPAMIGRDAHPIAVGETPAWLSTDGARSVVSWQVAGDTYTSVLAGTPEAAVELARALRFVPVDEWAREHGIDLEEVEPGPPIAF
jgi:hypothetical protein